MLCKVLFELSVGDDASRDGETLEEVAGLKNVGVGTVRSQAVEQIHSWWATFSHLRGKEERIVRSERTLKWSRILSNIEKLVGSLLLFVGALGTLGLFLEPEQFDIDAFIGVSVVVGLGIAFFVCGGTLKCGIAWPQVPLFSLILLLGALTAIGSMI